MPHTRRIDATPEAVTTRKAGISVDTLVVHVMEGTYEGSIRWATYSRLQRAESYARRNGGSVEKWLKSSLTFPTAAHYYFSMQGDITQMVDDWMKCPHANDYNSRSIGLEHEGRSAVGGFSQDMLRASARVTRILCKKYGIPMDRAHIIGHNEVPGATHTDPGPHWPWDLYLDLVLERIT